MTLTNSTKLRSVTINGDFAEATASAVVAEGAEALALTTSEAIAGNESGDWLYSGTAEGRTGEVAVDGIDLDGEPGLIYTGQPGNYVRVKVANLDVDHGLIAPEATDQLTAAVFVNNTIHGFADEGFAVELDAEPAIEFNFDTIVGPLQSGDVIRVGLVGGGEETLDLDVAEGGSIDVV
jgi:hypothetical protein